ncbi:MAG: HIT domain-containing protein [Chlamydiales bacterium]|nr:HIT domain-containing protein [Chlamydiales bacterium]
MEIETFSSAVGALAVNHEKEPAEKIYEFFQSIGGKQFLFMGNGSYLDFVPFQEAGNPLIRYGRQLFLLFRHSFYSPTYTSNGSTPFSAKEVAQTEGNGADFFCRGNDQVLLDSERVQVLYPDNPIVERHFLFATKAHRDSFKDMTKEEFVEVMALAKRVGNLFEGKKVYLCKTGFDAGQTVPHFHLHLMIETDKTEGIWGRLKVAKNILFNMIPLMNSRLQGEALLQRVTQYRGVLACPTS